MSFIKSSAIVSLGTLSSRILGFIRDLLIARFLGAGISSDILFIGLRIPNTFRQIFGEGAFNMAFVPLFKKYCDDNKVNKKALNFLEQTFSLFMLGIVFICIVCEILMPQILNVLAPSLQTRGPEIHQLAVNVSRILMPYILFVSYMTFMGAVLNSLGKFAAMAFAPAMVNVGYILAFVVYSLIKIDTDITYVPAWGFLFGGFLQFIVMYISIKRMPFTIKFTKPVLSPEVKLLFVKFVPTMLGSGIVILNSLVSVFLASSLEKGAVSYLFFSDRLVQLPTALFGTAIATVLLPTLTQKLKQKQNIAPNFIRVFSITLIIGAFCSAFMWAYCVYIVSVLFERGAFNATAVAKTSIALETMAIAIPAIMGLKITSTIFYSKGNTKTPTIIAGFSFALNLVLCLILMKNWGYLGLVIAGVIAIYFTFFIQLIVIIKQKVLSFSSIYKSIFRALCTFILLVYLFVKVEEIFIMDRLIILITDNILYELLYLFIMGMFGIIITIGMMYLFKLHKKV